MPMPVGYHPHMYGYPPHSSSSDVNNSYKYPYPASDYNYEGNAGKKAEKKPAPE